jgi:hypothetical protein
MRFVFALEDYRMNQTIKPLGANLYRLTAVVGDTKVQEVFQGSRKAACREVQAMTRNLVLYVGRGLDQGFDGTPEQACNRLIRDLVYCTPALRTQA